MSWRQQELAHFGSQVTWLSNDEAAEAQAAVAPFISKRGYELSNDYLVELETTSAELPEMASNWLKDRIRPGVLRVVFASAEVCVISPSFLLDHWQDMFAPSRDDAFVIPQDASWVLYFSHEEKIHYGRRKA